jgi:hypothetical protein
VVGHLAESIGSAQARARVHTFEIAALLGGRTVGIDHTFRSTGHIGIAKVLGDTLACCGSIVAQGVAHGVGAAGGRVAGINFFNNRSR